MALRKHQEQTHENPVQQKSPIARSHEQYYGRKACLAIVDDQVKPQSQRLQAYVEYVRIGRRPFGRAFGHVEHPTATLIAKFAYCSVSTITNMKSAKKLDAEKLDLILFLAAISPGPVGNATADEVRKSRLETVELFHPQAETLTNLLTLVFWWNQFCQRQKRKAQKRLWKILRAIENGTM